MIFRIQLIFLLCTSVCFVLNAQESPVQGDELLKILGQPRNSEIATKLNNFIGNKESKEDISFLNYGKGVQVNIERSIVKGIDLYNDNNPYSTEFKKFHGKLPLEIAFENTIFQVKQKIGEGFESSGEVSSSYQLIKVFKLNENDDYRMTVEFSTGRLIMVSLSFIEGGAGGADTPEKQQSASKGFYGNDFFTMIRKNQYNLEFTRFREILGYPTFENRSRKLWVEQGVEVTFSADGSIAGISLYSGGQPSNHQGMNFSPYLLDLPYGIRMENTKSALMKKLGQPHSQVGSTVIYKERHVDFQIAFKGEKIDFVKISLAE